MKKLLCKRGETLTEALVAILIVAISAAMLAAMITAAVNINIRANEATDEFYRQLSAAETGSATVSGDSVTVNGKPVDVIYYGEDEAALIAYAKGGSQP